MTRLLSLVCFAALIGCAATAGTASYEGMQGDYLHSAPVDTGVGSAVGNDPSSPNPGANGVNGAVLDRAAFVRAVLRENPSIEIGSAGLARRARASSSGNWCAFEDPMVELGLAPLSDRSVEKRRSGTRSASVRSFSWFGKRSLEASAAAADSGRLQERLRGDASGARADRR